MDETKEGRVLASVKRNYGPPPDIVRYTFAEVPGPFGDGVGRIEWHSGTRRAPAPPTLRERAIVFVNAQLADGPALAAEALRAATARGIGRRTLEAVKNELGVRSVRGALAWWWLRDDQTLPPDAMSGSPYDRRKIEREQHLRPLE